MNDEPMDDIVDEPADDLADEPLYPVHPLGLVVALLADPHSHVVLERCGKDWLLHWLAPKGYGASPRERYRSEIIPDDLDMIPTLQARLVPAREAEVKVVRQAYRADWADRRANPGMIRKRCELLTDVLDASGYPCGSEERDCIGEVFYMAAALGDDWLTDFIGRRPWEARSMDAGGRGNGYRLPIYEDDMATGYPPIDADPAFLAPRETGLRWDRHMDTALPQWGRQARLIFHMMGRDEYTRWCDGKPSDMTLRLLYLRTQLDDYLTGLWELGLNGHDAGVKAFEWLLARSGRIRAGGGLYDGNGISKVARAERLRHLEMLRRQVPQGAARSA